MTRPNPDIAIIYHYDLARALAGEVVDWQAIPVSLQAGREGGDLCRAAADFAKRRDLFLMPAAKIEAAGSGDTGAPVGQPPQTDAFTIVASNGHQPPVTISYSRSQLRARLKALIDAGHEPVIRAMWPRQENGEGVPPLSRDGHTVEQLTALFYMVRRVESEVSWPFNPEPAEAQAQADEVCKRCGGKGEIEYVSTLAARAMEPIRYHDCPDCDQSLAPARLDDGAFLDVQEIDALRTRMQALPMERQAQIAAIAAEANAAGRSISVQQKPCVRRWEIARALVLWAEFNGDVDDLARALTYYADYDQIRAAPNGDVGELLSLFTIEQAVQLADAFDRETAA